MTGPLNPVLGPRACALGKPLRGKRNQHRPKGPGGPHAKQRRPAKQTPDKRPATQRQNACRRVGNHQGLMGREVHFAPLCDRAAFRGCVSMPGASCTVCNRARRCPRVSPQGPYAPDSTPPARGGGPARASAYPVLCSTMVALPLHSVFASMCGVCRDVRVDGESVRCVRRLLYFVAEPMA